LAFSGLPLGNSELVLILEMQYNFLGKFTSFTATSFEVLLLIPIATLPPNSLARYFCWISFYGEIK
jgi:hypothetical protein